MDEPPLRICLVFDEKQSARRAEDLIAQVTPNLVCDQRTIRFDELSGPNGHTAAAHKAADADVLILAARGNQMLPSHVRFWLGLCLTLRNDKHEGALVALIAHETGHETMRSSILEYLETIALVGKLAFFAGKQSPPMYLKEAEARAAQADPW